MSDEIKLGRMARDLTPQDIEIRQSPDDKTVRLSFSASSEAPVERHFGTEVLSHEPGAIRMERIAQGAAPLLFNHDWNDPIGMVDGARVRDGRLMVDAHLFDTARAAEVHAMVRGGLRNISIGYEIEEMTEGKRGTFTATRWVPLECSVVSVPADASIGIGRQAEDQAKPVRVVRAVSEPAARAASPGVPTMAENQAAAGQAVANPQIVVTEDYTSRQSAMEIENTRMTAIRNLAKANNIDSRIEAEWIRSGAQMDVVAREILDIQVQRQETQKTYASAAGLSKRETQQYSLFKVMRAIKYGHMNPEIRSQAAFELECSREVAKKMNLTDTGSFYVPVEILQRPAEDRELHQRTMATTPGSKGGYMVDVTNMGFIDILRARSMCAAMGATSLPGLVGNVSFVRQTASPAVTWQAGEAAAVTAADQTLGQLSMTPKTAIVITDVTEQLLRQSSPAAEAFVMGDLARTLATEVDNKAINGVGGAQPLGIKNTTGITSGQDAASVTWDKVRAFWAAAAGANAVLGRPGWVTNAAGASLLSGKQRFSSTDTPIWEGNPNDGTIWGMRAMSSEQLASGNLIFGSWEHLLIGEWGVLELAQDNGGTRFNNATVGIRAMWMVDTLLRYPQAFVVSTNLS
ncbi:MAG: phage major capsid protein [Burkholderiaceae bacterium]|jgi:HK97 family phage major capsid protein/HK97 family phage prohead protease|nr:phage major capsid protein [Burkholderiaceae bacterium]MCU0965980.1 phage major capsid protein [Burkholderiaceae bacterium]